MKKQGMPMPPFKVKRTGWGQRRREMPSNLWPLAIALLVVILVVFVPFCLVRGFW